MSSRRIVLKKAERSVVEASDVKKLNDDVAELNFVIWLVPYMQLCAIRRNLPLGKSASNCSTERCRKESDYEIELDGNDEDTFEYKNISNSGYNKTTDTNTESVFSTAITNRKKSPFKRCKRLPVTNSDMQNAEMDFLRAMRGYAGNEEEKDENDIFGVLIATEMKKLRKRKQILTKRKIQKPYL